MPNIAIIGRQNVGKSTLFNALIRQKKSIVLDQAGITRDLISHTLEIDGKQITFTDFPGFEFDKDIEQDDEVTRKAIAAAEKRLKDFNLLIWVISRKGLSTFEQNLAKSLHQLDRPVWLVVNFVDDPSLEAEAYNHMSLGFKKTLLISALNKRGISDMVSELFTFFYKEGGKVNAKERQNSPIHAIRVAIVGKPNAGKSTLFNWLLKKEIALTSNVPGTTRDAVEEWFTFKKNKFVIVDTAGMRKKRNVNTRVETFSVQRTHKAIENSDIVLFLIDAREGLDFQNKHILNMIEQENKPMVLLANKSDLLTVDEKEELHADLRFSHKQFWGFPFYFTCALEGKKVSNVFQKVLDLYKVKSQEVSTSKLNKLLESIKDAPVMIDHQVKINYVTQAKPDLHFIFFSNKDQVPGNIRRFIMKQIRTLLDLKEFPIRLSVKKKH